jgi:hypothetical protein
MWCCLQLWVILGLLSTVLLLGYLRGKFNQYHLAPPAHSLYVPSRISAATPLLPCVWGLMAGRADADGRRVDARVTECTIHRPAPRTL